MTHHAPLLTTFAVAFVVAFILGALAHRLKLSPIIGYLLAGIAVGPYTPGFVADVQLAKQLAEMGVILLMFGVGLHFSIKDMFAVGPISIPGAIVQITAGTVLGLLFGLAVGWPLVSGLVFGLTLSVASTVVLLRALEDRRLLKTRRGQIAVGWLIVEDIAMILALILLPVLAASVANGENAAPADLATVLQTLVLTLLKVGAFAAVMLTVGPHVIPWMLNRIAMTGSRELFTLAILAIALGVAFAAAELADASFALGAFFAGMVLAGSDLSQNAAERSLPLRDAFAVLFFVSVGMLFNPQILVTHPLSLLTVVFIIVVGKSAAAFAIVRLFGYPPSTAATIAISLAQVGEFSFILGGLALTLNLIPKDAYDLLLGGAIFSIILNPLLFFLLAHYEAYLDRSTSATKAADDALATPVALDMQNHIIVVGYGRVGRHIADVLNKASQPFVIVDPQKDRIDLIETNGMRAIYGSAERPEILLAAGIKRARALMVAIPNGFDAGAIVASAKQLNPKIEIVARAHFPAEADHLKTHGAQTVLLAEQELAERMVTVLPASSRA